MIDNDFSGLNNFFWFVGVVEDRQDPHFVGRVRVRCFGHHTGDKVKLPTEDLPWSQVMLPVTSAGISGIGQTPIGLVEGSHVFGFFRDGKNRQEPVIMGSLPGYPSEYGDPTKGFYSPIKATDDPYAPHTGIENVKRTNKPGYLTEENSNHPRWINSPDTNQLATKLIQGNRSLSSFSVNEVAEHGIVSITKNLYEELGPLTQPGIEAWHRAEALVSEGGGSIFGGVADVFTGLAGNLGGNLLSNIGLPSGVTKILTNAADGIGIDDIIGLPEGLGIDVDFFKEMAAFPDNFIQEQLLSNEGIVGTTFTNIKSGLSTAIDASMNYMGIDVDGTKFDLGFEMVMGPNGPTAKLGADGKTPIKRFGTAYDKTIIESLSGFKYTSAVGEKIADGLVTDAKNKINQEIVEVRDKITDAVIGFVPDEFTDAVSLVGRVLGNDPVSFNLPNIDDVRKTVYPRNHVYESESGHIMEYDDTPDFTRVCQMHKSGTGYEIIDEGSKTELIVAKDNKRVKGNTMERVVANPDIQDLINGKLVPCAGHKNLAVDGHYKVFVNAAGNKNNSYDLVVGKNANINIMVEKGDVNINAVDGRVNLRSGQNLDIITGGSVNWKAEGKFILNAEDDVTIQGKNIYLN